ncbi:MAG: hypothetical protein KBD76_13750 [Bacteriovorax sp.]|nr:hypothetical protein [Bacteriovorax sp.]
MKLLSQISDNLTSFDRKLIYAAAATSFFALLLFLFYNPQFQLGNLSPVAHIKEQQSEIKHKFYGSILWNTTSPGETLYNGDEIYTGANGSAKIEFKKNKASIDLSPRSLVRIEELSDQMQVNLQDGQINIFFAAASSLLINNNGKTITITGKENSLVKAYQSASGLAVQLIKGQSSVNQQEIKEKKSYFQEDNGQLQKAEFPDILSPKAYQIFHIETDAPYVELAELKNWKGEIILLNLDNDDQKKFSAKMNSKIALDHLRVGRYQISLLSSEKKSSLPIFFEVKTKFQFTNISPKETEELLLERGTSIPLSWTLDSLFDTKVVIENAGLKKSFSAKKISTLSLVPFGTSFQYSWTLIAEQNDHFLYQTPPLHFSINYRPLKELISPRQRIFSMMDKHILFSWKHFPNEIFEWEIRNTDTGTKEVIQSDIAHEFDWDKLKSGRFEFALNSKTFPSKTPLIFPFAIIEPIVEWSKDAPAAYQSIDAHLKIALPISRINYTKEMTIEIRNKKNDQTIASPFTTPAPTALLTDYGNYCIKVKSNVKEELFVESLPYCFSFKASMPFGQLPRAQDQYMSYVDYQGLNAYLIKSPVIPGAVGYEFFVASDSEHKKIVFSTKSDEPKLHWISKRFGVYYFRYRVSDEKNRTSDFSPVSKLIFQNEKKP